jgi:hypothetical protein
MNRSATDTTIGGVESRILTEGYGEGAWHGPDLKAPNAFRRASQWVRVSQRRELLQC